MRRRAPAPRSHGGARLLQPLPHLQGALHRATAHHRRQAPALLPTGGQGWGCAWVATAAACHNRLDNHDCVQHWLVKAACTCCQSPLPPTAAPTLRLPLPLQHGRFHDLDKFEPNRRSCIAALSHHRQRRRTFGGKQGGRGGKQGGSADPPAPQRQEQQGQRAAAVAAVQAALPGTPCHSFGCCPSDSEAATPATPVCFAGEKGGRWQGASFAPAPVAPMAVAPVRPADPLAFAPSREAAAGMGAAHQPTAFSGLGPEAAVAEVPGPLFPQPQISTSSSEELAEVRCGPFCLVCLFFCVAAWVAGWCVCLAA